VRHRPAATYRVQFRGAPAPGASPGTPTLLRFEEAARLVPYLEALGVTDLYASPPFTARTGSTHGYDVTDPLRLDPLLGPPDAFAALAGALRGRGMGLLLDIVPNHQAATPENPAWRDVLRRGRGSPFARWFDIDWQAADGRVVLPVLDDLYGHVLARGDLRVEPQDASWAVRYRDLVLPATLPPGTAPGEVHAVLEAQPYRLAWWGVAQEGLNYRRFFDIADLAGVRVEDPEVFAATHALVADLVARGLVTGLRVDHVDGLADPTGYLARLRALAPGAYLVVEKVLGPGERVPPAWPVAGTTGYELLNDLTALLADPSGVDAVLDRYHRFVASSGGTPPSAGGLDGPVEAALGRDAGASRGAHAHLDAVVRRSKVEAMRHLFHGEVEALVSRLARLAARDPVARDLGRRHLRRAVEEVTAALRIYRTYLRPGAVSPDDRAVVERAAALARGRLAVATRSGSASEGEVPEPPPCEAVTFFRRVLLEAGTLPEGARLEAQEVVRAWQQLTGPVMAKGVEDTALYRFGALLAFNEVGGDPSARSLPRSVEAFHARMAERARRTPHALSATGTHDTKRGEDVRARLAVLSELAPLWEAAVQRWHGWHAPLARAVRRSAVPEPAMEWFLYQTLLGVWPAAGQPDEELVERLRAYARKAAREARGSTSWLHPDPRYEAALDAFLLELLQGPGGMRFREDLPHLLRPVAFYGALNSLVQVLLKLTVPGIPDIYQGGELWDLSLVDPDNRRPVDFALRARLLEELLPAGAVSPRSDLADLWRTWPDGRVKLLLTALGLRFRRAQAALFADGAYLPLLVEGPARRHACAFARTLGGRWAVTVMPRLACTLMGGPQEIGGWEPALPVGQAVWAETRVRLPAGAPRRWRNVLTGEEVQAEVVGPHGDGAVALGHLFRTFPLALLAGDVTLDRRHFGVLRSARGRPFRLLPE